MKNVKCVRAFTSIPSVNATVDSYFLVVVLEVGLYLARLNDKIMALILRISWRIIARMLRTIRSPASEQKDNNRSKDNKVSLVLEA